MSEYIQDPLLQKCALKIAATGELVALGAYRDMPQGFLVYVEYLENGCRTAQSIAATARPLVAFGVQLSVDADYGGMLYLKAEDTGDSGTLYPGISVLFPSACREPFFCF